MTKPILACASMALLWPAAAQAQTEDRQLWLAATAQLDIAKGERLTLESIGRFSDRAGGFFHSEFGAIGAFDAAKGVELALGFRHVQDWDHHRTLANEERVREQVTFTLAKGFLTRLRFEQRFNSTGGAVGVRLRPQLRFTLPIDRGLSLFATHESFINFNTTSWGQRSGYERIRHGAGVSIPLAHNLKIDLGYLNQYRFGRAGARDTMDHAATTSLAISL